MASEPVALDGAVELYLRAVYTDAWIRAGGDELRAQVRVGLAAALPLLREQWARERADRLREAATGRREYNRAGLPEHVAEALELEAVTLDSAARVVEGDDGPLYDWLPSWRWTDEMHARLDVYGTCGPPLDRSQVQTREESPDA